MNKFISVVIPVYNASKTIKNTIESVINQSYTNFEIIAIDDCSEDNSFKILEEVSKRDNRIIIYKNKYNLGVARTRNLGIDVAKGEYISFLDSDDIWKKDKLRRQLRYINEKNADICYTSYSMIENDTINDNIRIVPREVDYKGILRENVICCSTSMVKTDLLKKYQFQTEFFHEDFILWLVLLKNGFKAVGLQENLVVYRKGGRSSDKLKASLNRWLIYRKYEKLGLIKSIYYFLCYTINGIKKYY